MARRISTERKALFYFGTAVMIVGFVVFGSVFVSVALLFAGQSTMESVFMQGPIRGVIGFALVGIGSGLRAVGARGAAGSGLVLDPELAREELEPYSRMAGGMLGDALDEADLEGRFGGSRRVVLIQCGACGTRNEEESKFCQECGRQL